MEVFGYIVACLASITAVVWGFGIAVLSTQFGPVSGHSKTRSTGILVGVGGLMAFIILGVNIFQNL